MGAPNLLIAAPGAISPRYAPGYTNNKKDEIICSF